MKKDIGGTEQATAATARRTRRNNSHSARLFANCLRCTATARAIATEEFLVGGRVGPICHHLARNALTRHKFSFRPIHQLAGRYAWSVTRMRPCVRD